MGNKYAGLIQQTAQLRQAAARLSAELTKGNTEFAQSGIPVPETTLKRLFGYRADYQALRVQALELGQPQINDTLRQAGETVSLIALETALRLAHDEERAASRFREAALVRLHEFLEIVHKDGADLPSLRAYQDKARVLTAAADADEYFVSPEMEELLDDEHPLNALTSLTAGSENLDDERWERLHGIVTQSFDRAVTTAVSRGKLVRRPAGEPVEPTDAHEPKTIQLRRPTTEAIPEPTAPPTPRSSLDAVVSATVAIATPRALTPAAVNSTSSTTQPVTGQIRIAGSRRPLTLNFAPPTRGGESGAEPLPPPATMQAIAQAEAPPAGQTAPDTIQCLFCGQSIRTFQERCPHCKAILDLDDIPAILANTEVNEMTVREGIDRRKQSGDKRAENHVAIAIGYLNLKSSHEALGYLSNAYRANPRSEALRKQVSTLRQRKLVLVIDGSAAIRRNITLQLECEGHRTLAASDGPGGMNAMRQYTPDLVLLDTAMPVLTGYDVCKLIRGEAHTKHVPVIMLSASDGFFDKLRGRMAGASDHLGKPFDPAALLRLVAKHLTPADERDQAGFRTRTRHLTAPAG